MYRSPENEELLFHYLSGDASDEQKQSIYEWINQSKENRDYFDKVRADYILMVQASRANLISNNNLVSVLERIKRRKKIRISIVTTVSLSLMLFISISYSLNNRSQLKEFNSVAYTDAVQIRPGSFSAILQLSTGEQIDINNAADNIEDGSGTAININDEGEISYHSNKKEVNSAVGEIKYNKLIVPRGGEYMIKLSDGTKVWLNSASELRYPVEFKGENRTIYLKGEAYFNVAHNEKLPFIVCVNNTNLKVLGTSFNVNAHSAGIIETVLVDGSIEVGNNSVKRVLKPNERGVVTEGDDDIKVDEVDVLPYIAWKNGDFVFHSESLGSIMNKLSLWYNFDVQFKNENMKKIKLSGEMTRSSEVYDILYFFEKTSNVTFTIKDGSIIIN